MTRTNREEYTIFTEGWKVRTLKFDPPCRVGICTSKQPRSTELVVGHRTSCRASGPAQAAPCGRDQDQRRGAAPESRGAGESALSLHDFGLACESLFRRRLLRYHQSPQVVASTCSDALRILRRTSQDLRSRIGTCVPLRVASARASSLATGFQSISLYIFSLLAYRWAVALFLFSFLARVPTKFPFQRIEKKKRAKSYKKRLAIN